MASGSPCFVGPGKLQHIVVDSAVGRSSMLRVVWHSVEKLPSTKLAFHVSQRVSGPPCRAPAVTTPLLKRNRMKPTIWTLDGKMRTWRPPLLAEIWDRAPLCGRDFTALTTTRCGYQRYNCCIRRETAAELQCPVVTSPAVHTVCCSCSNAWSQLRIQGRVARAVG